MECDCVNSWLQGAEFNNGYDCDDANEVNECAPKVAKDGYNFEFQEDTSQSAIVSIQILLRIGCFSIFQSFLAQAIWVQSLNFNDKQLL